MAFNLPCGSQPDPRCLMFLHCALELKSHDFPDHALCDTSLQFCCRRCHSRPTRTMPSTRGCPRRSQAELLRPNRGAMHVTAGLPAKKLRRPCVGRRQVHRSLTESQPRSVLEHAEAVMGTHPSETCWWSKACSKIPLGSRVALHFRCPEPNFRVLFRKISGLQQPCSPVSKAASAAATAGSATSRA